MAATRKEHRPAGGRRRGEQCPEGGGSRSPRLLQGDCLDVLAALEESSVDAVVCDPPYAIGWQNESWDSGAIREAAARHGRGRLSKPEAFEAWCSIWGAGCLRAMKPGAFMLAFGSPRTYHRLAAGLEDAGLEIRDTLMWLYSSGMAKSRRYTDGRRTALKPVLEPIVLARRPLDGTTEETIALHGTGALEAEACRVEGRLPANALISHGLGCTEGSCVPGCAVALLDGAAEGGEGGTVPQLAPSRFLYCPKPTRAERDAGCEDLPVTFLNLLPNASRGGMVTNPHPTLKPIDLMRWLVRLACPGGGLVLDPFMGSGTTGVAASLEERRFCGIEINEDYLGIAAARIEHWAAAAAEKPAACNSPTGLGAAAPGRSRRPPGGRRRRR